MKVNNKIVTFSLTLAFVGIGMFWSQDAMASCSKTYSSKLVTATTQHNYGYSVTPATDNDEEQAGDQSTAITTNTETQGSTVVPDTSVPSTGSVPATTTDTSVPSTGSVPATTTNTSVPSTGSVPATTIDTSVPSTGSVPVTTAITSTYKSNDNNYNSHEKPIVDSLRTSFDGSLAQTLVGRAIWYMEYGYTVYGHLKYPSTGYIDCSNFVSLVYKDFGFPITSAAKNYNQVGVKVDGVYAQKIPGSTKYTLVGIEKLKPGDIFTFWNSDAPARTHIGHVAIYMGVVNGKPCIINTCNGKPTAIGIINDFSYWYGSSLIEVRRVLPDSAYVAGTKINVQGPVIPAIYQMKPDQTIVMPKNLLTGF